MGNISISDLSENNVTGLILSGGKGRRVAHSDKGLLSFNDRVLVEQQLEWLKPQVEAVMISANRNLERYEALGVPVIQDVTPDFPGPLEGILQGLRQCTTDWLFVQPVDVPGLPDNIVGQFKQSLSEACLLGYLKTNSRAHYLSMLIHKKLKNDLQHYIDSGGRQVKAFLKRCHACEINLNLSEAHFMNLNDLSDYAK